METFRFAIHLCHIGGRFFGIDQKRGAAYRPACQPGVSPKEVRFTTLGPSQSTDVLGRIAVDLRLETQGEDHLGPSPNLPPDVN